MRNLTIKREKSFVGSLAKMKVYIEEPSSSVMFINDVPCKKLGTLKNGEEKTFTIEDDQRRVFVIAGEMSKDFCNDYYDIPEGTEDVTISGKNKYNPASGNAFRFNNVSGEDVVINRKKGSKKGLIVLAICIVIGMILGVVIASLEESGPKTFSAKGMTITLTQEFHEVEMDDFDACFATSEQVVFVLKESYADYEELRDLTIEEYGEAVIQANEFDASVKLQQKNGKTYYEYKGTGDTGKTYIYHAVVYKGSEAFYLVQFAVEEKDYGKFINKLEEYASSVTVK